MKLVALTGGIGSGKSSVSRLLAERGAVIVDADAIVHELQAPGMPLLDVLAERFGAEIIREDGSLDRAGLADDRVRRRSVAGGSQPDRASGGAARRSPGASTPSGTPIAWSCSTRRC